MNIYGISKKEMNKIEKDFSKTVIGKKARIPVYLSILFLLIWLVVTVSLLYVSVYCPLKSGQYGYNEIIIQSEPMSYFISFLLVIIMCFLSYINYNRELHLYISDIK